MSSATTTGSTAPRSRSSPTRFSATGSSASGLPATSPGPRPGSRPPSGSRRSSPRSSWARRPSTSTSAGRRLAEQPLGWEPDLDDGVRLNIRPFVTANVLRARVNAKWDKDRGKNPDGSERINDLHPTLAQKRAARAATRNA